MKNVSLKTRIALWTSLLFIASSAVMTWFSLSYFEKELAATIASQQYSLVSSLALSIDNKLAMAQSALAAAATPLSPDMASRPETAQTYLNDRPTLHSIFDRGIFLFSSTGRLVAASTPHAPSIPEEVSRFREACRRTAENGRPAFSNEHTKGSHAIFMTVPLTDHKGKVHAVLGGSIDAFGKNFIEETSRIRIGNTGYLYICDQLRTIIVHPDQGRILERVSEGRNLLLDRAIAGFEGSGTTVNSRGVSLLSSFKRLPTSGWIVAVNLPLEEAYEPVQKGRRLFLLVAVTVTTALLPLVWFMLKRFTAPLSLMAAQVAQLPDKPPAERVVTVSSVDEIGALATAFNEMVASLDRQQEALRESEENYRTLAETADGMLMLKGDGSCVYANGRVLAMTGFAAHEIYRMNIRGLIHPDILPHALERISRVMAGEEVPGQHESLLLRKDGSTVPMEVTHALTRWHGEPADLIIMRDISARKRVEKELHDSYELLHKTISSLNEAVFILDTAGRVIRDCNTTAERMFGYHREELVGASASILHLTEEMAYCFGSDMLRHYAEKGYFETVYKMKRKDGSVFHSEHFLTPIHDDNGRIMSHVCVIRDVTERRQAEENLRAALVRVEDERAKSEAIIAALGEPMTIQDRDFRIIYQNDAHRNMVGSHEGKQCFLAYEEKNTQCENCPITMAFSDGAIHTVEKTTRLKGKTVYLEVTASPVRDASGDIVAGIEIVRDITGRKLAEEWLRESEAHFRGIFEGERDAVFIADAETGIIMDANLQAENLLGRARNEIIGMHQADLHPPEQAEYVRTLFNRTTEVDTASTKYADVFNARQERIPVEISDSIIDRAGGGKLVIGIFRDITERRRAEQEIRALNTELESRMVQLAAANSDLEAFGYSLSHDLKTPLTRISLAAQALQERYAEEFDEVGRFCVDGIMSGSMMMGDLIDAMLLLAQSTRGKLRCEEVDLSSIAEEVLLKLQVDFPSRSVLWSVTPGAVVTGDPHLLMAVIENLIGNAWKYTRNVSPARIDFREHTADGVRIFTISDNGAGFDMAEADRLFVPFQRLHDPEQFDGNGIGLATVRRIVQRHGGNIWGEGAPGKGATFSFTIAETCPGTMTITEPEYPPAHVPTS